MSSLSYCNNVFNAVSCRSVRRLLYVGKASLNCCFQLYYMKANNNRPKNMQTLHKCFFFFGQFQRGVLWLTSTTFVQIIVTRWKNYKSETLKYLLVHTYIYRPAFKIIWHKRSVGHPLPRLLKVLRSTYMTTKERCWFSLYVYRKALKM